MVCEDAAVELAVDVYAELADTCRSKGRRRSAQQEYTPGLMDHALAELARQGTPLNLGQCLRAEQIARSLYPDPPAPTRDPNQSGGRRVIRSESPFLEE